MPSPGAALDPVLEDQHRYNIYNHKSQAAAKLPVLRTTAAEESQSRRAVAAHRYAGCGGSFAPGL